jgi:hypothetical protein
VNGEPRISFDTFFQWNRIISAVNYADYITLTLIPVNLDSDANVNYIVERYKSFGDKTLYEFAIKLERLAESFSQYKPSQDIPFQNSLDLVKGCNNRNWMCFQQDILG